MIDDDSSAMPVPIDTGRGRVSTLDRLADIPEEEIWLQKQKSPRTRRAYRQDVQQRCTPRRPGQFADTFSR